MTGMVSFHGHVGPIDEYWIDFKDNAPSTVTIREGAWIRPWQSARYRREGWAVEARWNWFRLWKASRMRVAPWRPAFDKSTAASEIATTEDRVRRIVRAEIRQLRRQGALSA